jgi:hypothetical protein
MNNSTSLLQKEERTATYYCLDCENEEERYLCNCCRKLHSKVKNSKNHRIVDEDKRFGQSNNDNSTKAQSKSVQWQDESEKMGVNTDACSRSTSTNPTSLASSARELSILKNAAASFESIVSKLQDDIFEADLIFDQEFIKSSAFVTVFVVVFYMSSKTLLGRYSAIFLILLGACILYRMKHSNIEKTQIRTLNAVQNIYGPIRSNNRDNNMRGNRSNRSNRSNYNNNNRNGSNFDNLRSIRGATFECRSGSRYSGSLFSSSSMLSSVNDHELASLEKEFKDVSATEFSL